MKAFIILFALAASAYADAEAEADPYLLYGGYYGYAGYLGYPYGLVGKAAPCVNHLNQAVPCAGRKKREAEADPEAWYGYYGHPYAYGYHGYPYYYGFYGKSAPCVNHLNQPVPCAVGRKKREADPQLLYHAYPYHYPLVYGAAVKTTPCVNVKGEKVDCALGHKDIATAHIVPALLGRKKREADPVYFSNVKAETTVHEGKYTVPTVSYAAAWPYGVVPALATAEVVPYKYSTVAYKSAPVENPSDPTNPTLVHTSKLGVCLNYLGFRVHC